MATWSPYTYNPYATIPGVPDHTTAVTPAQLKRQLDAVHTQLNQVYFDLNQSNAYNVTIINEASAESPTFGNTNKLLIDNKTDQTTDAVINKTGGDETTYLNEKGEWHRPIPDAYQANLVLLSAGPGGTNGIKWLNAGSATAYLNGNGTWDYPIPTNSVANYPLLSNGANGSKWLSGGNSGHYLRGDGVWANMTNYDSRWLRKNYFGAWQSTGPMYLDRIIITDQNAGHYLTTVLHMEQQLFSDRPRFLMKGQFQSGNPEYLLISPKSGTGETMIMGADAGPTSDGYYNVRALDFYRSNRTTPLSRGHSKTVNDVDIHKLRFDHLDINVQSLIDAGFHVEKEDKSNFVRPRDQWDEGGEELEQQLLAEGKTLEDAIPDVYSWRTDEIVTALVHTVQRQQEQINILKQAYNDLT